MDRAPLKAVWYLYEDGSREYDKLCVPIKVGWLKALVSFMKSWAWFWPMSRKRT